ncbi:MAG: hypothetical protein GX293_00940, partial [Bacteroidales bacterium]|nr:hypothetical protein [Bacteroidales bacterium]
MKSRKSIALILSALLTINLFAQPTVVKLWPDGIPGSKSDPAYVENII